ncbi:hypothetical protein CDEST_09184 [Colletotrichum destructivum]|uniref:Uncharacterized protein n=1 Tax=Colletotrichum destructivum TaxID=34406 RepID=A0AAX4IL92_9PEZI|nr:hypothetical protein CDEST_09184 [Colletotrichum destructivum]
MVDKLEPPTNKPAMSSEVRPSRPPETPPQQAGIRLSTITKLIKGWWTLELITMTVGLITFALYLKLLNDYNEQIVDDHYWFQFPHSPFKTLQSVVAQLTTVMKLCMTYLVAGAMGQLKWYQFLHHSPKPVADLQAFDAASRGISGSAKLLFSKHRLQSLNIALGCVFFLATFYSSSSAQNTVTQGRDYKWYPTSSRFQDAAFPFSISYNISDPVFQIAEPGMQAAILAGWTSDFNPGPVAQGLKLPILCSTGVCRWFHVTSLNVGYECQSVQAATDYDGTVYSNPANISNHVSTTHSNGSVIQVPASIYLKSSYELPVNSTFNKSFAHNPGLIVHLAAITKHDEWRGPEAVECIVFWQVRSSDEIFYDVLNMDGTANITAVPGFKNHMAAVEHSEIGGKVIVLEGPCNNNKNGEPDNDDVARNSTKPCRYEASFEAHEGLREYMMGLFGGHIHKQTQPDGTYNIASTNLALEILLWALRRNSQASAPLHETMKRLLSNVSIYVGDTLKIASPHRVQGEVATDQYYLVNWWFVLYLGGMLALSIYLFLFAIWRTRHLPIWKTSLLPFLYHGFDQPMREQGDDSTHLAWMELASEQQKVALWDEHDGLGLKLRTVNR